MTRGVKKYFALLSSDKWLDQFWLQVLARLIGFPRSFCFFHCWLARYETILGRVCAANARDLVKRMLSTTVMRKRWLSVLSSMTLDDGNGRRQQWQSLF